MPKVMEEEKKVEPQASDVIMEKQEHLPIMSQPSFGQGSAVQEKDVSSSGGFFGSLKKLFTFGPKKEKDCKANNRKNSFNEQMDDEAYMERNNSACEMDEDDLEGDLNLSDDGEEGQQRRGFFKAELKNSRASKPSKKVRKFRQEFDTNVTQVSFKCLENKGQMATGDPFHCERCKGVFNKFSKLRVEDAKQLWDCEFCNKINEVMIDDEEVPPSAEVTYLIEASAQVQDRTMGGQDISVVFCVDSSGSMCVTQPI